MNPSKPYRILPCFYVLGIAVFSRKIKNSFSLFTAYQILRSERENCLDFLSAILKCRIEKQNCTLRGLRKENRQRIWLILDSMLNYLWKNKLVHGYIVLEKNKDVVIAKYCVWPHLWPSTDSDYVETMLTRAPESTVSGHESP